MPTYPRPCSKCGALTGRDGFALDRSKASGHKSHCKHCESARALQWHELNRADVLARKASKRKEAALMREQERRRQSVEERAETKRRRERLFRELRERAQA